ncbi:hypothetical protein ACPFL9_09835 [Paenarthrobacter sp. NyZ202]|uniref:hypothetical protein n=1 Tax=Paenarthrobacter sp. NyZ202 TaxID=3402689 RepID=UPI003CEF2DDA
MNDPMRTARLLIQEHATTLERLWVGYWGNGGNASMIDFDAYIHEARTMPEFDRTVLTWAIEETRYAT